MGSVRSLPGRVGAVDNEGPDSGDEMPNSDGRPGDTAGLQRLYDLVPVCEEVDVVEDVEEEHLRTLSRELFGTVEPGAPDSASDLVQWLSRALGATVIADYRIDDD